MGANERVETQFRETLRRERESRGWSQANLAKLLSFKGLTSIYPTTIAKIEAGERVARIDEIVAIADAFEVSLDTLLGHDTDRAKDKDFLVAALCDTGMRSLWQINSTRAALRAALADLDAFTLRGPDKTVYDGCQAACNTMADAAAAIRKTETTMTKIEAKQNYELRDFVRKAEGDNGS